MKDGESLEVALPFDREGNLLYYGQWKDGKRHGRGTAFDKTGTVVFDGEWKEDAYFKRRPVPEVGRGGPGRGAGGDRP